MGWRLVQAGHLDEAQDVFHLAARRVLGWSPRPNDEAVVGTAESLIQFGLVQP